MNGDHQRQLDVISTQLTKVHEKLDLLIETKAEHAASIKWLTLAVSFAVLLGLAAIGVNI